MCFTFQIKYTFRLNYNVDHVKLKNNTYPQLVTCQYELKVEKISSIYVLLATHIKVLMKLSIP